MSTAEGLPQPPLQLSEPYRPRTVRWLELWREAGWQIKVYSLTHASKTPDPALLEASKEAARRLLPQPAATHTHYGVGFIGIHQGHSYDFVTVAWWAYETELYHHTLMRPSSQSYGLMPATAAELSSDVWDIKLLAFERDAWVEEVLYRPDEGALSRYLARILSDTL
jgi:hypothetical protein